MFFLNHPNHIKDVFYLLIRDNKISIIWKEIYPCQNGLVKINMGGTGHWQFANTDLKACKQHFSRFRLNINNNSLKLFICINK